MKNRLFLAMVLVLLESSPLGAVEIFRTDAASLDLKGTYKNLFFASKERATGDPYVADLNRFRTEWDGRFFKVLGLKFIWDNELIGGDYVQSGEFALRQTVRNAPYGDLDYELARRRNFFYGQSFYRAFAAFDPGPFVMTVGRQKIDWGSMRLFSPGDLFTRIPIYDIEKEERVGVTAVQVQIPVAGFRINPVYAFDRQGDRSRAGARVTRTFGHFDVSVLGGRFLKDACVGIEITGDLQQAGVRAEFLYDWAGIGRNFAQLALGVDYGFSNTLYVALEYFFNGQGTNNAATITPFPATANQIQSVHQNFAGLEVKYDLTPLWMARMETIVDLNGGSVFLNPEMKYSIFSWFEVSGGAQIPAGKTGGEFTALPAVYYVQAEVFW